MLRGLKLTSVAVRSHGSLRRVGVRPGTILARSRVYERGNKASILDSRSKSGNGSRSKIHSRLVTATRENVVF